MFEYFRYQCFVDGCRTEIVLLLRKSVSGLFDCLQFFRNARFILLKGVGYLATVGGRVDGENSLRRTYEVAVGVAYPELAHVPGVVGYRAYNVCAGLLGSAIHGVYVIDEEDNFNAAAALSRWGQARPFGLPIW